ncbi:transient receptor potential cation channel subfamily M member 4-like isoform X1 [Tachysurus ichikawai]
MFGKDAQRGDVQMSKSEKDQSWITSVIKKRVCTTFVEDSFSNGRLCQCGSPRESHASVTLNDYFSTAIVSHWESSQHTSESPTDAYGEVAFAGASKRHSNVGNHFPARILWKELFNIPWFFTLQLF